MPLRLAYAHRDERGQWSNEGSERVLAICVDEDDIDPVRYVTATEIVALGESDDLPLTLRAWASALLFEDGSVTTRFGVTFRTTKAWSLWLTERDRRLTAPNFQKPRPRRVEPAPA
jgi:hypothetical protein